MGIVCLKGSNCCHLSCHIIFLETMIEMCSVVEQETVDHNVYKHNTVLHNIMKVYFSLSLYVKLHCLRELTTWICLIAQNI